MKNRIREARELLGLSAEELGKKLQVSSASINHWEAGRRQIPNDKLIQLAEVLGFTVDYLLGRNIAQTPFTKPVSKDALYTLHGQPIWTASNGWMLVNIVKAAFILDNLSLIPFDEMNEPMYLIPPAAAFELRGIGKPLNIDSIFNSDRIWVEPITSDTGLASALRGWYHVYENRLVQNEFGNRFYIDVYGVKWLAFENCILSE